MSIICKCSEILTKGIYFNPTLFHLINIMRKDNCNHLLDYNKLFEQLARNVNCHNICIFSHHVISISMGDSLLIKLASFRPSQSYCTSQLIKRKHLVIFTSRLVFWRRNRSILIGIEN